MPDFYSEPYLHLAGLTHKSALIAWGAFYFKTRSNADEFKLVDDSDLKHVFPPRRQSIGAVSEPYGPAEVTVRDAAGTVVSCANTAITNHVWVSGLQPDTAYSYEVVVKGEPWASGQRRDWVAEKKGLQLGRTYVNAFRTLPDPTVPVAGPLTFAVIGDFGAGVRKPGSKQQEIAQALETIGRQRGIRFIVTTGDNIYAQRKLFGVVPIGSQGDEDDDWFFTFYQPYRYLLNQMPVYPSIGNHDTAETEAQDDRGQLEDNLYIRERIAADVAAGRASRGPGLFYRFRVGANVELIALDTSKDSLLASDRLFLHENHRQFLGEAFPPDGGAGTWRIPFGHHPPLCAGPQHRNTGDFRQPMGFGGQKKTLLDLFARSGVRVVLSGHEHNFQCSRLGPTLFVVTGGAAKVRPERPGADAMASAHTESWAAECHFLLVTIEGKRMTLEPIAGVQDGQPRYVNATTPAGAAHPMPMVVELA
jgi:tartrate-resistant acid phosphatase type 5